MSDKNKWVNDCLSNDSDDVINGVGQNRIPPPEKEPLWKLYLEKFKDPIIIVLLIVFVLSIAISAYELITLDKGWSIFIEPSGVLVALLLATGVGFIFELKADREFEVLNKVKDARPVKAFRRKTSDSEPRLIKIKKHDVVKGDIIKLESGDEVPADGYLILATSLRVDESNFTGELYANKTTVEDDFDTDATYPSDFLLRGSTVIEGNANISEMNGDNERVPVRTAADGKRGAQTRGEYKDINNRDGLIRKQYTIEELSKHGYTGFIDNSSRVK